MAKRSRPTPPDRRLAQSLTKLEATLIRHEEMLSMTLRRIADIQAEVDVLKHQFVRHRLGKKR